MSFNPMGYADKWIPVGINKVISELTWKGIIVEDVSGLTRYQIDKLVELNSIINVKLPEGTSLDYQLILSYLNVGNSLEVAIIYAYCLQNPEMILVGDKSLSDTPENDRASIIETNVIGAYSSEGLIHSIVSGEIIGVKRIQDEIIAERSPHLQGGGSVSLMRADLSSPVNSIINWGLNRTYNHRRAEGKPISKNMDIVEQVGTIFNLEAAAGTSNRDELYSYLQNSQNMDVLFNKMTGDISELLKPDSIMDVSTQMISTGWDVNGSGLMLDTCVKVNNNTAQRFIQIKIGDLYFRFNKDMELVYPEEIDTYVSFKFINGKYCLEFGYTTYTFQESYVKESKKESISINNNMFVLESITNGSGGKIEFVYDQNIVNDKMSLIKRSPERNLQVDFSLKHNKGRLNSVKFFNNNEFIGKQVFSYLSNAFNYEDASYYTLSGVTSYDQFSKEVDSVEYKYTNGVLEEASIGDVSEKYHYDEPVVGAGFDLLRWHENEQGRVTYEYEHAFSHKDVDDRSEYYLQAKTLASNNQEFVTTYEYDESYNSFLNGEHAYEVFTQDFVSSIYLGEESTSAGNNGFPTRVERPDGLIQEWDWSDDRKILEGTTVWYQGERTTTQYFNHNEFKQPQLVIERVVNQEMVEPETDKEAILQKRTYIAYDHNQPEGALPKVGSKLVVANVSITQDMIDQAVGTLNTVTLSQLKDASILDSNGYVSKDLNLSNFQSQSSQIKKLIASCVVSSEEFDYNNKGLVQEKRLNVVHVDGSYSVRREAYLYNADNTINTVTVHNVDSSGNPITAVRTITPSVEQVDGESLVVYTSSVQVKGQTISSKQYLEPYTGLLKKSVDENDKETIYRYDARNRLNYTKYPNGAEHTKVYYDNLIEWDGQLVKRVQTTTPLTGAVMEYYDQLGRLVFSDTPEGLSDTRNYYDVYGQLDKKRVIKGAEFIETDYVYDPVIHSRLTGVTVTDNNGYQLSSNTIVHDDALNKVTSTDNQTSVSVTESLTIDGLTRNLTTSFPSYNDVSVGLNYDETRRFFSVSEPNVQTNSFSHNSVGQLEKSVENGYEHNLDYDLAGNVLTHDMQNVEMYKMFYDSINRTEKLEFGANNYTFGYDTPLEGLEAYSLSNTKGRLAWAKYNGVAERALGYDSLGLVNKEVLNVAGNNKQLSYHHDVLGRLDKQSLGENYELVRGFNNKGQLETISLRDITTDTQTEVKRFWYDGWGRLEKAKISATDFQNSSNENYFYIEYKYDEKHRLKREDFLDDSKSLTKSRHYEYNSMNFLENIIYSTSSDKATAFRTEHYEYDDRGQLELASYTENSETKTYQYNYDANGNRQWVEAPGQARQITVMIPGTNRVDKVTNLSGNTLVDYSWDELGRLEQKVDNQTNKKSIYSYNNLNQLEGVVITQLGTNVVLDETTYEYYSTGMLKSKTNKITTDKEYYIYDKNDLLQQVLDENGAVKKTLVYNGNTCIGEVIDNKFTAYLNDHLGSKRGIYSVLSINPEYEDSYSPYGIPDTDNAGDAIYTGKLYHANTGLYYFNARWFDPEMGIFLTEDPAKPDYKDPLTMNTYAYCKNNPIMNIDPDGEFWWIVGAVVGALWAGSENNWDLGKMFEGAVKGALIGGVLDIGIYAAQVGGFEISASLELPDYGVKLTSGLAGMAGIGSRKGSNSDVSLPDGMSTGINQSLSSMATGGDFEKWASMHGIDSQNINHPFSGTDVLSGVNKVLFDRSKVIGGYNNMILYSGSAFRFALNGSDGNIDNLHVAGGGTFYNGPILGANNINVHWSFSDLLSWTVGLTSQKTPCIQFGFGRINSVNYIYHDGVRHADWHNQKLY